MRQHDNSFFGDPVVFRLASGLSAPILPELAELGAYTASKEAEDRARLVSRHRPLLHLYDNSGTRCEEIDFHPAYHSLLTRARHAGIASSLYQKVSEETPVRHQTRAMRLMLLSGIEGTTLQELCLASAALGLIHIDETLCGEWKPLLISHIHDPLPKPYPSKQSAILSFALENPEGVQAPAQALPLSDPGQNASTIARLYGQKSAVINPLADGFIVQAQSQDKQSLFLVPRFLADGSLNNLSLSPAYHAAYGCADVHFHASAGWRLGPVGGADILLSQAQHHIQCDINIMRTGMMRRALRLAVDRMRHDEAQGQNPQISSLQACILADAALDCTAATLLVLRLARAFDQAEDTPQEATWAELALPLISAWIMPLANQILDVATQVTPRSYTHAFSHEEGNFMSRMRSTLASHCGFEKTPLQWLIDALEKIHTVPSSLEIILADLDPNPQPGSLWHMGTQMRQVDPSLAGLFAEQFSYHLAASLMHQLDMDIVTSAFMTSRLGGKWRSNYGMLAKRFNPTFILETLYPSA